MEKTESWTNYTRSIEKGNYCIITVPEQIIGNESFIKILNEYNLQVKKFVYCHIRFGEQPLSRISKEHANEYISKLEANENVFGVIIESFES